MSEEIIKPEIYEENKGEVLTNLKKGELDFADLTKWSFQDKFFAFLLATRCFEILGANYPSPRSKEEIPIWFLLICYVQMKLHTASSFNKLPGILESGAILSRVKFNVGQENGGFNNKNKKERKTVIHFDTARKFFKDTDPLELRDWHNKDCVKFFKSNRGYDKHGIFILDQTHIVVPDNNNYKNAKLMAVDEHGQRIDTSKMTDDQKKVIRYRLCYALSTLVHYGQNDQSFIFSGYQWGPGNTDELPQGRQIVRDFVNTVGKGVMKLLITDRGYIDGSFVTTVKKDLGSDVLLPLKKDMCNYNDAKQIAESCDYKWIEYDSYEKVDKGTGEVVKYTEHVTLVKDVALWDKCQVPLHISLMKKKGSDGSLKYWGLASTFKPKNAREAFDLYKLRVQTEERNRQIKNFWEVGRFSSPNASLIEAHVVFTLLTYSLLQLYLNKKHLIGLTNKTIMTLQDEESLGINSVIVYYGKCFGVFELNEYSKILLYLDDTAKERMKKWVNRSENKGGFRVEQKDL